MAVARSGRRASREDERLGLLEIARTRGMGEEGATALPPGQRDASGFWFPAAYRAPMELFSQRQRSLQAKQRSLKSRRARPDPAQIAPAVEDVPLPLLLTDIVPAAATPDPSHGPHPRDDEPRARHSPGAPRVDSPGRSV